MNRHHAALLRVLENATSTEEHAAAQVAAERGSWRYLVNLAGAIEHRTTGRERRAVADQLRAIAAEVEPQTVYMLDEPRPALGGAVGRIADQLPTEDAEPDGDTLS